MKIKEIITERYLGWHGAMGKQYGLVKSQVNAALPNVVIEPELRNTDAYMQLRYGVAMAAAAASQDKEFEQESPWAENIGMVAYSEKELEQIKNADKLMGVSSVTLTGSKSMENSDIGSKSPVANTGWRK